MFIILFATLLIHQNTSNLLLSP